MNIITRKENGILTIEFNRPDKKNSITSAMYQIMADTLKEAEKDAAVRVILFCGQTDMFTAGNDLEDFMNNKQELADLPVSQFIGNLSMAGKPIIAAVAGSAVGIGTTMLLHCDLVYLAETARLTTPFVNLALVPEAASSWLLPARIGHVRAYAMFALGEPLDAASALACGLANAVVPAAELRARARAAAEALTKRPPGALSHTKALMRDFQAIAARIDRESVIFAERLMTAEAREAFTAFAERRPPDFSSAAG